MTATPVSPDLARARMRGCAIARERAFVDVFGESEPRGVGFEFLPADTENPEIGPLRLLRFPNALGAPPNTSTFVTSGLSDPGRGALPFGKSVDDRFSGIGIELVLSVADAENRTKFAERLLAEIALDVASRDEPAMIGDLIDVDGLFDDDDDDDADEHFSHVIVLEGGPYRSRVVLPAGHCVLLHAVGLFDVEVDALLARGTVSPLPLIHAGLTKVSSRRRPSLAPQL